VTAANYNDIERGFHRRPVYRVFPLFSTAVFISKLSGPVYKI